MIQPVKSVIRSETAAVRTRVCGGLGNQLFQYAAARALSLRLDCPLVLDLSFYDRRRHRQFELDRFSICADWTLTDGNRLSPRKLFRALNRSRNQTPVYKEQSKVFDPNFHDLTAPVELDGYFFSDKYFADQAETLRTELQPHSATDGDSLTLQSKISERDSTALHIRRGDYVSNKKASDRFWSCTLDYYERAMEHISGTGSVFVFSDDIQWAKENLRPVKPLEFVDANPNQDGIRDMWLMTHAHHHIIANSSFSWWGAWLAGADKGMTIAPTKWFNDPAIDDSDMVPEHWIRI
jgi:hypothetical protein